MKAAAGRYATVLPTKDRAIFKKAIKKAEIFFGVPIPKVELVVIDNIDDICKKFKIKKEKIPWYAVGFYKGNKIFVLNKDKFLTRGHKKKEFFGVVLHELCHIQIKRLVKKRIPVWVEEGICNYLAFPLVKPKKMISLSRIKTMKDWYRYDSPYVYCSYFFAFLVKKYGKDRVLKFLKLLKKHALEKAFLLIFEESLFKLEKEFRLWIK